MSAQKISSHEEPARNGQGQAGGTESISPHGLWWKVWLVLKVLQARLRFVAILVAVGAVIVYWDTLLAYYEKWTRPILGEEVASTSDIEYWCPMHPTVVRDHPDKCPICGMPLSRRKKSEGQPQEALPPGVLPRVQLTPYRVAVAGIETAEVSYQPLTKDITTVGSVEFDETKLARITARASGKSRIEKLYVNVTGQTVNQGDPLALLYSPDLVVTVQNLLTARRSDNPDLERLSRERLELWGIDGDQIDAILRTGKPITRLTLRAPISGHVIRKYQVEGDYVEEGAPLYDLADLHTVWIEAQVYEDEVAFLKGAVEKKLAVVATTRSFPNREFPGVVAFVHPHLDAATRTLTVRFNIDNPEHDLRPGMYATVRLRIPMTQLELFPRARAEEWANENAAEVLAHHLFSPGGLGSASLLRAGVNEILARHNLVLAVPEGAVIDTGSRKVVYRETEPELFEGVEVQLGPRSGGFYPVVHGLHLGDRVATSGSFLIDAETRLTAGAGSTYFGASGGPQSDHHAAATSARLSMTKDEEDRIRGNLAQLSPTDRSLALAQEYCPIKEDNRVGSMGVPVKVLIQGQPVFLCCKGCVDPALAHPEETLAKAKALKAQGKTPALDSTPPKTPAQEKDPSREDLKVQANLAKLSSEDRKLVEAQKVCPVQGTRLGLMGPPVKLEMKGQTVFLCCPGCVEDARANPDQTVAKAEQLRRAQAGASQQ